MIHTYASKVYLITVRT